MEADRSDTNEITQPAPAPTIACLQCGHTVLVGAQNVCPECGTAVRLRLAMDNPRRGPRLLAMWMLGFFAIYTILSLIFITWYFSMHHGILRFGSTSVTLGWRADVIAGFSFLVLLIGWCMGMWNWLRLNRTPWRSASTAMQWSIGTLVALSPVIAYFVLIGMAVLV